MAIILGTTPTIKYKFYKVDPSEIVAAYLTFKQDDELILEKDLGDSTLDAEAKTLSWTLSQEESLALVVGPTNVMLNWKTVNGTRGASDEASIIVQDNHKKEVI